MEKNFRVIGIIPARFNSKRFPGKLLQKWQGKTILQHVYGNAKQAKRLDEVYIATQDKIIGREAERFNAKHYFTPPADSGTERIGRLLPWIKADIIVNIQGDEPLIKAKTIDKLVEVMIKDNAELGTIIADITEKESIKTDIVKAYVWKDLYAIDFSRYIKTITNAYNKIYKHIGIYAYKREMLEKYLSLPLESSERVEKLEQLRAIENGHKFRVIKIDYSTIAIDTIYDLEKLRNEYKKN